MSPTARIVPDRLYKAVSPERLSFFDGCVAWEIGAITRHPRTLRRRERFSAGDYLSASSVATDCTAFRWPCRLFVVEPAGRERAWQPSPSRLPHKWAASAFRVLEERPAHEVFGPQGEQVVALLERLQRLTPEEALAMAAAGDAAGAAARDAAGAAAWDAAWDAARDAAGAAAWDAAGAAAWDAAGAAAMDAAGAAARDAAGAAAMDAAGDAARDAAWAAAGVLVRDVLDPEHYRTLTGPAASVLGPLHPDDVLVGA